MLPKKHKFHHKELASPTLSLTLSLGCCSALALSAPRLCTVIYLGQNFQLQSRMRFGNVRYSLSSFALRSSNNNRVKNKRVQELSAVSREFLHRAIIKYLS